MKICDWQCHFTMHQLSTWQELERLYPGEVKHIVAKLSSDQRKQQGWKPIDLGDMDVIHMKRHGWFRQGLNILRMNRQAIHVFGGFWADRRFLLLIVCAVLLGIKVAVMNESYAVEAVGYLSNSSGLINRIKVIFRPVIYRVLAMFLNAVSRAGQLCVIALSRCAEVQFQHAGFAPEQIFPFGYFVPKQDLSTALSKKEDGSVHFVFVGSLLERKGIDLAVQAVEALAAESKPVSMDIYGHGDAEQYVSQEAKAVTYKGCIPFGAAQQIIAGYDALLLPSRHEGWGVVANEALLQGVPVIVSSHVGAKCLIEASGAGMVFKSGDVDALHNALASFAADRAMQLDMRRKAGSLGGLITPERAATYMRDVFLHFFSGLGGRPKELWYDPSPTR